MEELDIRLEVREGHGKRRWVHLPPQCRLELAVATVDAHPVAGNVGRREERQAHDVVPVQVRHEDVIRLRRGRPVPRYGRLSERSRAAAQVAEHVMRAVGLDLHAGSMATEEAVESYVDGLGFPVAG